MSATSAAVLGGRKVGKIDLLAVFTSLHKNRHQYVRELDISHNYLGEEGRVDLF